MLSPAVTPRAQRTRPPTTPEPREKENSGKRGSANRNRRSRALRSAPLSPCVTNTPRSSPSPGLKQRRLGDLPKGVDDALAVAVRLGATGRNTPLEGLKQRRLRDLENGEEGEDRDKDGARGGEVDFVVESPCVKDRGTPLPELRQRRLRELQKGFEAEGKKYKGETEQECVPESPCVKDGSTPLSELRQRRLRDLQKGVEDDAIEERDGTQEECVLEIPLRGRAEKDGAEEVVRNLDKKLSDESESESVKKSRKRRFEDIGTHANVTEPKDTDHVKRLHKTPILSTPEVKSTTSKAQPNPFDHGFAGSTSAADKPRPNPFDNPLPATTTSAAPIRSYSRSHQTKHLPRSSDKVLNDPPVRALVSYEDLWEGVSSIASSTKHHISWTYDAEAPMYDFLYDGIWKRRAETSLVSVAKRKRVFWRGGCWYGGWCRIGACGKLGAYHDLDCPHLDDLIIEAE